MNLKKILCKFGIHLIFCKKCSWPHCSCFNKIIKLGGVKK